MTTEEIRKVIKDYFTDNPKWVTHYEKGNVSSWRFGYPGEINIYTGDGGAKLIMESLEEQIKKEIDDNGRMG